MCDQMKNSVERDQKTFRTLVDAMSYPGRIRKLESYETYKTKLFSQTVGIVLCLVDPEVSFHIYEDTGRDGEEVLIRTNSKVEQVQNADYIIIGLDHHDSIPHVLDQAKLGDLVSPDESATLIIEIEDLESGEEDRTRWTGPGIDGSIEVIVSGMKTWIQTRNDLTRDFPLGLDIILVDRKANITCLPRTTQVEVD